LNKQKRKILIIVQDLRISGTSEGIVSRSFIGRLRQLYPYADIDVEYFKNHHNNDRLDLLPVNRIQQYFISRKIPLYIIWLNKIWWRLSGASLNELYLLNKYRNILRKISYKEYSEVYLRSSGQEYEVIRASKDLPLLTNSIINFHDPYPVVWDTGSNRAPRRTELNQFKDIWQIVRSARACITPSQMLSYDMENLYGSKRKFYVLPHQYVAEVFEKGKVSNIRKRKKQVCLSYHGALQLGRDLEILLRAYQDLLKDNPVFKNKTELVLRLRGANIKKLREKYSNENIEFLKPVDFATSSLEQTMESDILIVLENCATHSNILVGKAPFLAATGKPILSLSPERSEMRRILRTEEYAAYCSNKEEISHKLKNLIDRCLERSVFESPFKDYFEPENFKILLKKILE
jgi:hypothetical protein